MRCYEVNTRIFNEKRSHACENAEETFCRIRDRSERAPNGIEIDVTGDEEWLGEQTKVERIS
jgi:hypothetical protein